MVNDVSIMWGIVTVFVMLGVLLPYVNADLRVDGTQIQTGNLQSEVGDDVRSASTINIFTVLFSVVSMFFWSFGQIPFFLECAFFIPARIMLAVIIARNVWIG